MTTIIKFENVFNYNRACEILYKMLIDTTAIKSSGNGVRYGFYDLAGNKTAEYNENTEILKVYNYNTHNHLVGKELKFNV